MMRIALGCIILCLSCAALAQDAHVVELSSLDQLTAKTLYQKMLDAQKAWADFQDSLKEKYLVVDRKDRDASDNLWFPPQVLTNGLTSTAFASAGNFLVAGSDGSANWQEKDICDPERVRERTKWEAEQKKIEEEREAKVRAWRKGWTPENCIGCGTYPFEFSSDFRFIVPKPPEPPKQQYLGNSGVIWGASNSNSSTNGAQ